MRGARIRFERQRHGLTQRALAEQLGVSARTVAEWEAGRARPRNSSVIRLARLFGVRPEDLL